MTCPFETPGCPIGGAQCNSCVDQSSQARRAQNVVHFGDPSVPQPILELKAAVERLERERNDARATMSHFSEQWRKTQERAEKAEQLRDEALEAETAIKAERDAWKHAAETRANTVHVLRSLEDERDALRAALKDALIYVPEQSGFLAHHTVAEGLLDG